MDLSRIFIQNLKKWRKVAGLSQKKLAEKCGAAHSYIRQIEGGVGNPSFALLAKIAQALEIEPYQLFFSEGANLTRSARERQIEAAKGKLLEEVSTKIHAAFEELKK
ncbi:MAG: helix-turn-helix domain-containing protein [Treponema sp.]|jgi:transcriptional regulator with XRE-family HTH domain|nr:helix-turn-helix domain-containing protein [Treponema sp.]